MVSQTAVTMTIQQILPQLGLSPSPLQGHGILWWILYGGSKTLLEPRQLVTLGEKKSSCVTVKNEKMA